MAGPSKLKQVTDIAELLNTANQAAEDTGEGKYSRENGRIVEETKVEKVPEKVQVKQEVAKEPAISPQQKQNIAQSNINQTLYNNNQTQNHNNYTKTNNFNSQNVSTGKDSIKKIIDITDKYRSYDEQIKSVVNKFVRAENDNIEEVVFKILNTNKSEINALIDLVDLKNEDGTSRAFSLMSYDINRLNQVSNLLIIFNSQYDKIAIDNKIEFCRNLERGIDTLNPESLNYLSPVRELLVLV